VLSPLAHFCPVTLLSAADKSRLEYISRDYICRARGDPHHRELSLFTYTCNDFLHYCYFTSRLFRRYQITLFAEQSVAMRCQCLASDATGVTLNDSFLSLFLAFLPRRSARHASTSKLKEPGRRRRTKNNTLSSLRESSCCAEAFPWSALGRNLSGAGKYAF
jgi:hypothetical protein